MDNAQWTTYAKADTRCEECFSEIKTGEMLFTGCDNRLFCSDDCLRNNYITRNRAERFLPLKAEDVTEIRN